MRLLRTTFIAFVCSLVLSFNTLAAGLLAVEQCMQSGESNTHQMATADTADMQSHTDCAEADQGWISATAQLLCDQGGECQVGGAVVPSALAFLIATPEHVPPVLAKPGFDPTYPTAFWRPPRH